MLALMLTAREKRLRGCLARACRHHWSCSAPASRNLAVCSRSRTQTRVSFAGAFSGPTDSGLEQGTSAKERRESLTGGQWIGARRGRGLDLHERKVTEVSLTAGPLSTLELRDQIAPSLGPILLRQAGLRRSLHHR